MAVLSTFSPPPKGHGPLEVKVGYPLDVPTSTYLDYSNSTLQEVCIKVFNTQI